MNLLLTSLALTANAVAFGLISYRSITATIIHIQNGNPNLGMLPLATAFFAVFIVMISAMPTARTNLIAIIDTSARRGLARLVAIFLIAITGLGIAMVAKTETRLVFGALPEVYLFGAFGAYALLMIAVFMVPGVGFPELREVRGQTKVGLGYQSTRHAPEVAVERIIPGWIRALLLVPVLLFFAALIAFVYGIEADFLPLPDHVALIESLRTKILAVFIPLFGILGLFATNKPGKGIFKHKVFQLPVFVIACGAGGFLIPVDAKIGFPALQSLFVTVPRVDQEVVVVQRGHGYRRRGCDQTAEVTWPGVDGYLQTLCDVPRDLWDTLVPGDRLLITGPRTQYGQRYDTIVKM